MRRPWIRRLTLPLWAAWLGLAVTERPLSFDCPMRAPAGESADGATPMAPMAGMHHTAQPKTDLPANVNCCGCLSDCGTAPGVPLPMAGALLAIQYSIPSRRFAELTDQVAPVVRSDLARPYPNAPPLSALI